MKKMIAGCALVLLVHPCVPSDGICRDVFPFQLSLMKPVQLIPSDYDIYGLSIGVIFSFNETVYGLNVCGLISAYWEEMSGLQLSGFANLDGLFIHPYTVNRGIQVAGVMNNVSVLRGIQLAGFYNRIHGEMSGIQIAGLMNRIRNDMFSDGPMDLYGTSVGLQFAAVVNDAETFCGAQIGLVNIAGSIRGVQIGLINYARRMSGVQIGLINIIREGTIPFFPLFNISLSF
ncbi:MAG: hypothetical protein JXA20_03940 [Spirochaetes bacterium]|nr:hypothetical protein [Spirochaetota bacterium]